MKTINSQQSTVNLKWAFKLLILLVMIFNLKTIAQIDPPGVRWKRWDWAPKHPIPSQVTPTLANAPYQTADESGEDWWYDHENSYSGGALNGFICAEYASFVNLNFQDYAMNSEACSNHTIPLGPNNYDCDQFEYPYHRKGTSLTALSLISPDGKTRLWYKNFAADEFYRVIQTSDGGYIAVGKTSSSYRVPFDNNTATNRLYYNPVSAINKPFFDCSNASQPFTQKAYVVKVDANGNLEWQNIYGKENFVGNGSGAAITLSWAFGVVEDNDGFIITGYAIDYSVLKDRAFLLKMDKTHGYVMNKLWIDDLSTPALTIDLGKSWEKKITSYVYHNPNTNQDEKKFVIGGLYFTNSFDHDVFALQLNEDGSGNFSADWFNNTDFSATSSVGIEGTLNDIDILKNAPVGTFPNIVLPIINECHGCLSSSEDNRGTAKAYLINGIDGHLLTGLTNPIVLGEVRAYDLKIGSVATENGGFAVVSTKVVDNYLSLYPPYGCTPSTGGTAYDPSTCWNSDAYVAKFDNTSTKEWETIFDSEPNEVPEDYPEDFKKQECLYHITEADDGGLVISGNNSYNFDDSYLVRLNNNCQNTFFTTIQQGNNNIIEDHHNNNVINAATYFPNGSTGEPTITGDWYVKGSIHVPNGTVLHIGDATASANLQFADTRKCGIETNIIVEAGGVLEITNGAILTSLIDATSTLCRGSVWDGIQVWGTNGTDQTLANQGYLGIDAESTIENARVGINLGGFGNAELNGGIINANHANFHNNRKSIGWDYYQRPANSAGINSYINECIFLCDAPMNDPDYATANGDPLGVDTHVSMYGVSNIFFTGNTFQNISTLSDRGYGLVSVNSQYQVTPACTAGGGNPCSTKKPNVFDGFNAGLIAGNTGINAHTIYVDSAEFINNHSDMRVLGVPLATIIRCRFNEGRTDTKQPVGLYLDRCTGYWVEGNDFTYTITPLFPTEPLGVVVNGDQSGDNTGITEDNEIYRNTFSFLGHGCRSQGINGRSSVHTGLQFKCNTFTDDVWDDISITSGEIRDHQGECVTNNNTTPAGNEFQGSAVSSNIYFSSTASHGFVYNRHDGGAIVTPSIISNGVTASVINCQIYKDEYSCHSRIIEIGQSGERSIAHYTITGNEGVLQDGSTTNRTIGQTERELFDEIRTVLNDTSLTNAIDSAIAILGTPQNNEELKLLLQLQLDKGDSIAANSTINLLLQDSSTILFAQTVDSILQVSVSQSTDSAYSISIGDSLTTNIATYNNEPVQVKVLKDFISGNISPLYIELNNGSGTNLRSANKAIGVKENNSVELQVKPVPTSDEVTISINKFYDEALSIEFVEPATGRVLIRYLLNENQSQKNCSLVALLPGFYLCILRKQNEVIAISKAIKL